MVGFSKRIATAVWVGNKADEKALRDKNKAKIYGAGVPADIWRRFMTAATKAMNEPKVNTKFNPPNYAGDENPPGSVPGPDENRGRGKNSFPPWFPWPTRPPRG
jgi:membrane peptidoglycan carboxypeptidase